MAAFPFLQSVGALRRLLTGRKGGIIAGVTLLVIFLGCMSIAIGNRNPDGITHEDGTLVQEGETNLPPGGEQDVYYPISYEHPPNLEVTDTFDECEVVEQHEDHFRVKNRDKHFNQTAKWKARGVRAATPVVVPVPDPPPPALPTPPTPVQQGP